MTEPRIQQVAVCPLKPPHESLEQFPVIISFPLHWGDQDPLGHVNNIMYLRWAETTRIEYLSY